MTVVVERRYRRLLRVLPRGYRQAWEEDMVGSFLESGSPRVPWSERLSVLGLAGRLWLTGAYASPRALVWHRAAQSLILNVLLIAGASELTSLIAFVDWRLRSPVPVAPALGRADVPGSAWAGAFFCLIFSRYAAARVFAVLAAVATYAGEAWLFVRATADGGRSLIGTADVLGWIAPPAIMALLVALAPRQSPPSRRFWLSAFAATCVVLLGHGYPALPRFLNTSFDMILLMGVVVAAFALATSYRAPHRPIAIAAAAAYYAVATLALGAPAVLSLVSVAVTVLALAIALPGLLAVHRSGRSAGTGSRGSAADHA